MAPLEKVKNKVVIKNIVTTRIDLCWMLAFLSLFILFINKQRDRKQGARRRLPINCGSIAKPLGWGKPKLR